MSGNSYDEMSDTDQVSKMQESSEDEDADFYSIHTTSKLSTSIRASMQLEITDSEYSDFEGFDKFLEDDRSIEDNPKDNSENLVTTQPSDTDERVMEKKQKWLPIIRKKILRKNVLKSGQSGSRSSNDQSILPQETPSVTRPEIMDRDLRDSSQFLENDTSIEDHDTNSTTSEDHVTPQPTDTEEGTVENKQKWRPVIQKTILRKNVLTSGQSILPKEIPSVTQPEIVDSDSGENFLENDTSVEDHHTNSTTSEDHVTPQPTDTDEGAVENKRSQSNSSSSNNESILSNQTLTIKIEYPVKTMLTIFAFCGFLTGILILLVGAMFVLEDPKQASLRAQMEYIENEVDLTLFRGAVRIQSIKGQAVSWNSTVKISDLKEVISAIRGGFEAEGFSIASVEFFQLSPVNVTVYSYLNHTVTSLNAPKSTTNNTLKANGWRMIVRATLECTGKPSKNAIGLRVGAVEIGMIQFMLDNYLANQRIVARMEAIEVSDEFKEGLKVALRAVPRLANIKVEENQDTIFIACHKKGADMPLSNILVRCPPDCHEAKVSEIIGTHSYHIQSSVCLAATHNHVIQLQNGGVVEYLESGTGFVFEGIPSNGVNSTSREEFSRQFIVKKPGSSWAIPDPTVTPTTTLKPLQEPTLILMEIAFMLLELDGQKVSFSMLTVRHVNNLVVEAITIKFKAALQAIGFDIVLIKVANLSPSLLNVASVKVKLHVYGGFMANAWAMFPYKPWKNADVDRLEEKVTEFLGRIHTVDFEIKLNLNFVSQLEITPSTTQAPITKYTSKCGCGDVFFIQINDSPEKTKILSIYKSLLNAFTFDQLELGLGLALDGTIITRVGQDLAKETLRRLEEELNLPERNEISLWRLLADLESESSFLMQGIGKRKKLLIISSSYVFGADAKNIEIYLNRIKDRGVSIAYVGYEWDQKLLQAVYYPLKFASKPSSDFVFHVDNLNYFNRLAKFMGNVIRRYVCESPPTTCEDLHFAIPPPINMQYNFSVDGSRNSYTKGIPVGTGLKEYTSEAGSSYNGVDLPATQTFRKTEPDKDQAFYRRDRCGQQANQPSFPSGRIVGGSEALPHSWPWAISINYVKMQNGRYNYNFWKCGGSVIDKRWILTAAHCFANGNTLEKESKYQVAIGIHDQRDMNGLYGNIYKIDRIVHHPQYDDYRNKFDIALLYLDRDIQYRREVAPVCLPNADVIPATARECWVVGWGYTSNSAKTDRYKLKQAVQRIESPTKCQSVYKRYYYDPNYNLCSKRSTTSNVNMQCRGDSGGPLVCRENGRWVQYGISNFGPKMCESGGESGYFLVSSAMQWICCYVKLSPCTFVKCNYSDI